MMFKKILFAILTASLAFSTLFSVFATTDTPSQNDLTNGLVVAYDFEGDTDAIKLQDKAPNGTVRDNLQVMGTVVLKNGEATCGATQNADYLMAPKGTDDLKGLTEYTVYLKLKVAYNGSNEEQPEFFSIPGITNGSILARDSDTEVCSVRARSYILKKWVNLSTNEGKNGMPQFKTDEYIHIAYTAKMDSTTGIVTLQSYFSNDGTTYKALEDINEAGTLFQGWMTTGGAYCLHLGQYTKGSYICTFDDFFIYSRALSAQEVGQLSTIELSPLADKPTPPPTTNAPVNPDPKPQPTPSTQAPTKTDETPTEGTPATQTPADSGSNTEKSGCGSVLPVTALGSALVMSFGCAILSKQKGERK